MVFLSQIASEKKWYEIQQVLQKINTKLIERHPHVFSDTKVEGVKDILQNWEKLKKEQKKNERKYLLDGIPKALPAINKAIKIQEKLSRAGFDWENLAGVLDKLEEELEEMKIEIKADDKEKFSEELGDVLFVLVNLGLKMKIDPEAALQKANAKVISRLSFMEDELAKTNQTLEKSSLEDLELLWQKAKKKS
jgi:MazG family protein